MIKAFFSSIVLHLFLLASILYLFSKPVEKKVTVTKQKVISLKHIVLKKAHPKPKKVIEKEEVKKEKKEPPKKPKKIEKKKIKKKKTVKKTKKPKKRVIQKRKQVIKKSKTKPNSFTPKAPPTQNFLLLNKDKIYEAIQRAKRYPRIAKKLHIQGVVKVSFILHPNGSVTNIKTSGANSILQKSARKTIIEASPEFPKPTKKVTISLNIAYKLR